MSPSLGRDQSGLLCKSLMGVAGNGRTPIGACGLCSAYPPVESRASVSLIPGRYSSSEAALGVTLPIASNALQLAMRSRFTRKCTYQRVRHPAA